MINHKITSVHHRHHIQISISIIIMILVSAHVRKKTYIQVERYTWHACLLTCVPSLNIIAGSASLDGFTSYSALWTSYHIIIKTFTRPELSLYKFMDKKLDTCRLQKQVVQTYKKMRSLQQLARKNILSDRTGLDKHLVCVVT